MTLIGCSVGLGLGRRARLDAANASASLNADSHVTSLTPGLTPRVLDQEEFDTIVHTVSDSENTVVELGAAVGSDNTTRVSLEDRLVGLDGY